MRDISIIVPTYNRSDLLELTLISIAQQELKGISLEVIIVDDGSTDNTKQTVERYMKKIEDLKYLYNEHDGYRVAYVRNIGIRNSQGDIIIFVDSGMILCSDFVSQHYLSHEKNKNAAVIGSIYGYAIPMEDREIYELIDMTDLNQTFCRVKSKSKFSDVRMESFKYHSYAIDKLKAPYAFFWTGNVSAKRASILQINGFDENYKNWGMEDIDMGYRLFASGLEFILNLEAKTIHVPHKLEGNAEKVLDNERDAHNKYYFHKKFRNIDSELFVTGCQDQFYNRDLDILFENTVNRYDFGRIKGDKIINIELDEQTIIYGGLSLSILKFSKGATILEYDKEKFFVLKKYYPQRTYHLMGTRTDFSNQQFQICLVTDFWIYMNEYMLLNLLKESIRIAEKVYILYQVKAKDSDDFEIQKSKLELLISFADKLNIRHITYEYSNRENVFMYLKLIA